MPKGVYAGLSRDESVKFQSDVEAGDLAATTVPRELLANIVIDLHHDVALVARQFVTTKCGFTNREGQCPLRHAQTVSQQSSLE